MDADSPIHVADAVRFLAAFAPERLAALRRDHPQPDAAAVLQAEGAVLGGSEAGLDAAAAAIAAFLEKIDLASVAAIRAARRRLGLAQYVDLAGRLLGLGSATVLIALLLQTSDLVGAKGQAVALAAIGFLAAAIPLVVAAMRGSIADPSGLQGQYAKLKEASFEAALLRGRLAAARAAEPRDGAELAAAVEAGNAVAKAAVSVLTDLGYDLRLAAAS